jgi:Fur family ferric uptake transcriptional regulator
MCYLAIEIYFQMQLTEKKILAILRQRGYKLTPQRRAVLNVIARSENHLVPADIYERVHQEHRNIGRVTVYRTLAIFSELGLICEVHIGDKHRSYLLRRLSEHHHHLICSDCGKVVDFTACELDGLEQRLSAETGFEIESHLLDFVGRCPDCEKIASA